VVSTPPGADLYVDKDVVGRTPQQVTELKLGQHRARVELRGYRPEETWFVLTEQRPLFRWTPRLTRQGALQVVSTPAGADLYVDGKLVGQTPQQVKELELGEHRARVELKGYEPSEKVVVLTEESPAYSWGPPLTPVARPPLPKEAAVVRETGPSLPKSVTIGLGESTAIELVLIRAGEFVMGSPADEEGRFDNEGPQHRVGMAKPFYMSRTEVTQRQWRRVMGDDNAPWSGSAEASTDPDRAASRISWLDAQSFCAQLNSIAAGQSLNLRLPTEAEWEYACRAGSDAPYCFGNDPAVLAEYAWFGGNSSADRQPRPHKVAQKKSNAWELYDMHGNVWEWCEDLYAPYPSGAQPDGSASGRGQRMVLRGGGIDQYPPGCRSAVRTGAPPDEKEFSTMAYGFRIVGVPKAGSAK
jgi:formylglycine-generating enzyme required for sulfatase activity